MRLFIISILCALTLSCTEAAKPVAQNTNAVPMAKNAERAQTAIAHGPQEQAPPGTATGGKSKWSQSGDPINTKEFDSAIAAAEKALSSKPADQGAKKTLAAAYYRRAEALTEARQYASALGDYRRTLKYDPSNKDSQDWIERIISIYDSINRESPKEGEEPPPLAMK
ncbi:MAG: hypothetical protein ABIV21_00860 [Pyrinomonadaceae bacterium]